MLACNAVEILSVIISLKYMAILLSYLLKRVIDVKHIIRYLVIDGNNACTKKRCSKMAGSVAVAYDAIYFIV
jgi:hypothetical protein